SPEPWPTSETVRAVLEREAILRAKQALQHSSTGSSRQDTTGISSRKQGSSPRSQPKKKGSSASHLRV
ncbi:hypothetical protein GBAR_LOCUS3853, partial [Geodia barretti]